MRTVYFSAAMITVLALGCICIFYTNSKSRQSAEEITAGRIQFGVRMIHSAISANLLPMRGDDHVLSDEEIELCGLSQISIDPWNNSIRFAIDGDGDGYISLNGIEVNQPVIAWSYGENCIDDRGTGDDIVSWLEL